MLFKDLKSRYSRGRIGPTRVATNLSTLDTPVSKQGITFETIRLIQYVEDGLRMPTSVFAEYIRWWLFLQTGAAKIQRIAKYGIFAVVTLGFGQFADPRWGTDVSTVFFLLAFVFSLRLLCGCFPLPSDHFSCRHATADAEMVAVYLRGSDFSSDYELEAISKTAKIFEDRIRARTAYMKLLCGAIASLVFAIFLLPLKPAELQKIMSGIPATAFLAASALMALLFVLYIAWIFIYEATTERVFDAIQNGCQDELTQVKRKTKGKATNEF